MGERSVAMCNRSLPKYHEYIRRLELFSKALGVKVEYAPEDGEGSFSPATRKIRIDPELSEAEEIATFLHELGHAVDDMLIDDKVYALIDKAYTIVYDKKVSKKQQALVVNCEKRAWQYGRSIAKQLKIRLGKWYTAIEVDCLRRYSDPLPPNS